METRLWKRVSVFRKVCFMYVNLSVRGRPKRGENKRLILNDQISKKTPQEGITLKGICICSLTNVAILNLIFILLYKISECLPLVFPYDVFH